jgi:hypothetical protein
LDRDGFLNKHNRFEFQGKQTRGGLKNAPCWLALALAGDEI